MPRCPSRPLAWHRRGLQATAALALCAAVVLVTATPASAYVEPIRTRVPIVAGTELQYPGTTCTAGLVVIRSSVLARLSPRSRATRYVVTAKHCGGMGTRVSVRGAYVGSVSWVDPHADLALVRIDPEVEGQPTCAPTSQGFHCTGSVSYRPRASGRVILTSLRTRSTEEVPVIGTGSPAADEVFCVSGKASGEECSWSLVPWASVPWEPGHGIREPGEMAARSPNAIVYGGDSGAPIATPGGRVYGILQGDYFHLSTSVMIYTAVSQFFEDAGAYALAPA
jgi:hypothetical protein